MWNTCSSEWVKRSPYDSHCSHSCQPAWTYVNSEKAQNLQVERRDMHTESFIPVVWFSAPGYWIYSALSPSQITHLGWFMGRVTWRHSLMVAKAGINIYRRRKLVPKVFLKPFWIIFRVYWIEHLYYSRLELSDCPTCFRKRRTIDGTLRKTPS